MMQLFRKIFLTKLSTIRIWVVINFIENYRCIIYKTDFLENFPFTHICIHIWCRFSDTEITMMSQRLAMHVTHKIMHSFSTMQWFATSCFGTLLANFGFVICQNQIIHVIIGFKHDVPCIVRLEALGYISAWASGTNWSSWPLHASDLTMHGISCLNPLTHTDILIQKKCNSSVLAVEFMCLLN